MTSKLKEDQLSGRDPIPREGFADLLPVQSRFIAPGEYQIRDVSGHQILFYVEGSALAEWLRDRINESLPLAALVCEMRTHHENGCRNDARFRNDWIQRATAAMESNKS